MQIIGFSGYAGAGKDSAAQPLLDAGWEKISFADPMREMAAAINPIVGAKTTEIPGDGMLDPGATLLKEFVRYNDALDEVGYNEAKVKYPEIRNFLQRLGTEGGRDILGDNIWIDTAIDRMKDDGRYVITDVRFANEAQAVHMLGGRVVRVMRPHVGPQSDHASEKLPEIDHMLGDFTLNNDGTLEELHHTVQTYILDLYAPA